MYVRATLGVGWWVFLLPVLGCSAAAGAQDAGGDTGGASVGGGGAGAGIGSGGAGANGATASEGGAGGVSGVGGGGLGAGGGVGAGGTGTQPGTCTASATAPSPVDCASVGIQLQSPFATDYQCYDLGDIPIVPKKWGGLTAHADKPDRLLLGGNANMDSGALYEVGIARDALCHVLGFTGQATQFAAAAYNDGGVTYGPKDVLFLARWPNNELGLLAPGSNVTDKVIDLQPLGVESSPRGLGFVPEGFGGEGQLKLLTYPTGFGKGGQWYTVTYASDGAGLYDLTAAVKNTQLQGGPEGFTFIKAGNPQFPVNSVLVSEWNDGKIAAYELDAESNPIPSTRREFLTGFNGPEGALLDPLSGDFLFSTFDPNKPDADHAIVVRGFGRPPPIPDPK